MDIVKWVQDYVDGAYQQWATLTRQTMQDFADDMQPWLDELLENPEGRDARREWAAFVGRWSARVDVDPQSYINFEDWLVQHVEHGCCEQCAQHDSKPAADYPLAEAASPAAPASVSDSDDSYSASEDEQVSLQNEIATYFYDQEDKRRIKAQREAIIAILGPDWNNVSVEAVKTLRREGLIADEDGGFVSPLTVTIGLSREDGGTDTLVLRFEWPWFSGGPHWEQERYLPATDPAKEGQRIARQNDQRHNDVMRVRGATIQAQMGVYEMLMSGGGLIFILQGIDQFLTAGRSLASEEARESLITNAAASFYQHVLGMDPQEAMEAGRRVDQLLPLIVGLGETGLNALKERFRSPVAPTERRPTAISSDTAGTTGPETRNAEPAGQTASTESRQRPSWRQSELDVGEGLKEEGYKPQQSFKAGEQVKYGTRGSSRPEYYRPGSSIEVKNYNVESSTGRTQLVRDITNQAEGRIANLPEGTRQTIRIDIRGQTISNEVLKQLVEDIVRESNGLLAFDDITFIR